MSEDKLKLLLARVNARLERNKQAELKVRLRRKHSARFQRINEETSRIAADFALRLRDRAIMRRLLSEDRLDGARFRFYCEHFTDGNLEAFREWIDRKMLEDNQKALELSTGDIKDTAQCIVP